MNKRAHGFGFSFIVIGVVVFLFFGLSFYDTQPETHMIPGEEAYGPGIDEETASNYRSTSIIFMVLGAILTIEGIIDIIIDFKKSKD